MKMHDLQSISIIICVVTPGCCFVMTCMSLKMIGTLWYTCIILTIFQFLNCTSVSPGLHNLFHDTTRLWQATYNTYNYLTFILNSIHSMHMKHRIINNLFHLRNYPPPGHPHPQRNIEILQRKRKDVVSVCVSWQKHEHATEENVSRIL